MNFWNISALLILHGCQLCKHPLGILSCMAVNFSTSLEDLSCRAVSFSNISGTTYPAWLSAFQTSLGHRILHGWELCNHLWNNLSFMAVSFSNISAASDPVWLSAFQTSLGHRILQGCELSNHLWNNLSCVAVSFSNIFGHPILNGCAHFNHLWNNLEPSKHVWGLPAFQASLDILSCMAVNFSTISGIPILHGHQLSRPPILDGCELYKHLWHNLS